MIEQDLADEVGWDVEDLFDEDYDHDEDYGDGDGDGDDDESYGDINDDKKTARGLQIMIGSVR